MTLCERCGNYPNICGCAEVDALEARLAEAERLLRRTVEPTNPYDFLTVLNDIEAFLRAAVSASVTNEATK